MFYCLFNRQLFLDTSFFCKLITNTDNSVIEYILSVKNLCTHTIYCAGSYSFIIERIETFNTGIVLDNGTGTEAKYVRYGLSQALAFYKKAYYVSLEMNYDTEESLNVIKQFALNVSNNIK